MNWMEPLNDENKLQVDKMRTKTEKYKKSLKTSNILNFSTFRYKLTALRNIFHLIPTWKPISISPVSISRLHEKFQKISEKIEREKCQTQ